MKKFLLKIMTPVFDWLTCPAAKDEQIVGSEELQERTPDNGALTPATRPITAKHTKATLSITKAVLDVLLDTRYLTPEEVHRRALKICTYYFSQDSVASALSHLYNRENSAVDRVKRRVTNARGCRGWVYCYRKRKAETRAAPPPLFKRLRTYSAGATRLASQERLCSVLPRVEFDIMEAYATAQADENLSYYSASSIGNILKELVDRGVLVRRPMPRREGRKGRGAFLYRFPNDRDE